MSGSSTTPQASLLPNGRQQFVNAEGQPLVGGMVYMYAVGTENPQTTWANPTMTAENTNPIILDDLGSASIYGIGSYRQVLTDAQGNVLWDEITDSGVNSNNQTVISGSGPSITLAAGEAIVQGAPVYLNSEGTAQNSNGASGVTLECNGIAGNSAAEGASVTVWLNGATVSGVPGVGIGNDYYLGTTAGSLSLAGANQSGQLFQYVGYGIGSTEMSIAIAPAIIITPGIAIP